MKTYKLDPGDTLNLKIEMHMSVSEHIEFNEFEIQYIIENYLKLKAELSKINYFN